MSDHSANEVIDTLVAQIRASPAAVHALTRNCGLQLAVAAPGVSLDLAQFVTTSALDAEEYATRFEFPELVAFSRLPPIEDFIKAPDMSAEDLERARRQHVLSRIRVGSFLKATVAMSGPAGVKLTCTQVLHVVRRRGKREVRVQSVEGFGISAVVARAEIGRAGTLPSGVHTTPPAHHGQTTSVSATGASSRVSDMLFPGDAVVAVVTRVNVHGESIQASFRRSNMREVAMKLMFKPVPSPAAAAVATGEVAGVAEAGTAPDAALPAPVSAVDTVLSLGRQSSLYSAVEWNAALFTLVVDVKVRPHASKSLVAPSPLGAAAVVGAGGADDSLSESSSSGEDAVDVPRRRRVRSEKVSNKLCWQLEHDSAFRNPLAFSAMCGAYGVDASLSCLKNMHETGPDYVALCSMQDVKWATERVAAGNARAQLGDYDTALHMYRQAAKQCPSFVDAYVAAGAALANQGKYKEGIAELQQALSLDPEHANAKAYLALTEQKLARQADRAVSATPARPVAAAASAPVAASAPPSQPPMVPRFGQSASATVTPTPSGATAATPSAASQALSAMLARRSVSGLQAARIEALLREELVAGASSEGEGEGDVAADGKDRKHKKKKSSKKDSKRKRKHKSKKHKSKSSSSKKSRRRSVSEAESSPSSASSSSDGSDSDEGGNGGASHPILNRQLNGLWA